MCIAPEANATAGAIADTFTQASYEDLEALEAFASQVDCITFEFENIPSQALSKLSTLKPIAPNANVLYICQHRQREKDFLKSNGFPCADFRYATSPEELEKAVKAIGFPSVIKTTAFGYDGKGQIKLTEPKDISDCSELWSRLDKPNKVVVEKWINHIGEYSVVCARKKTGETTTFPMAKNVHINHILHSSSVPALLPNEISEQAAALAKAIADALDVVGLIAIEYFRFGTSTHRERNGAIDLIIQVTTVSTPVSRHNLNNTYAQLQTFPLAQLNYTLTVL